MKVLSMLTRVYLPQDELRSTISFYEELLMQSCSLRFSYADVGLELAQVGSVLLIAGSETALEPFRATHSTFVVDGLGEFQRHLEQAGAQIISHPRSVPTGRNMRVVHPDGLVVEYVEHVPAGPGNAIA